MTRLWTDYYGTLDTVVKVYTFFACEIHLLSWIYFV